ncbi:MULTISPECIES: DUF2779 domain-containing protein [unclassified Ruegeria]|uniref:DUF2779 domain-containing protein n=1 Tax=unclassified Ruegeria TaxID=2625375 RepID=UPI001489443E
MHESRGDIEHREFLHRGADSPIPALIKRLREDIGDAGSVLAWYVRFEKSRNKEMAAAYPVHAEFLEA